MTEDNIKVGWNLENTYTSLPHIMFTAINVNPVSDPKLVILNDVLATSLGLDTNALKSRQSVEELAGNRALEGGIPLAQAYAGHQFGHFTMLGDGRALLLGEQITPSGELFDIQLKGSGRTPYSRGGDGRAGLGPMLREYIISESMHGLGIPTTRSLAVVITGEDIMREVVQPGAIMTRIAASHLRVGTFQYAAKWGSIDDLKALADYAIERHYPIFMDKENRYLLLLQEVIERQAALIAKWQLVGFIHGVMNTDNMTISGETIDYGPCAFMDIYNPKTVFSSIDTHGRYAYENQPNIAAWNLARLAESLLPLIHEDQDEALEQAQEAMTTFPEKYEAHWLTGMGNKLGIFNIEEEDISLIDNLLQLLKKYGADYTNTFRLLTLGKLEETVLVGKKDFEQWHETWQARLEKQEVSKEFIKQLMQKSNPVVIPRNHRVEEALEAAVVKEDYSVLENLLKVISNPYDYNSEYLDYTSLPLDTSGPYKTFCGT
ncbi:YdiU family protein [Psychrobacillus sp. INOP01]|uniref:protein adenylyltransferase SelO n=1 Tax=Psychrobacillus sp. INOP01 TaxID=2829187 RepID=UPI001BAC2CF2|nr:YdiU family protein [Psychrobacillus sp. INOP01]QUG41165.1 YdiU family protein [Psychrobacillus sp. INOP01]